MTQQAQWPNMYTKGNVLNATPLNKLPIHGESVITAKYVSEKIRLIRLCTAILLH